MGFLSLDEDGSTTQQREATLSLPVNTGANNSGLVLRSTQNRFVRVDEYVPAAWRINGTRATCKSVRRAARCDSEPMTADI